MKEGFSYKMSRNGYDYIVSEDLLEVGDYYYDFQMHNMHGNAIYLCDSQELADRINTYYRNTPFNKRRSAKIIATNDPALNVMGVPGL